MYDTRTRGRYRRHHPDFSGPDHPHEDHDPGGRPEPGEGFGDGRGRGMHHPGSQHGGGPRGRGPRGRGGPFGRAQRGDVRAAALLLLAEGPMHGYQLMQAIAERTGGAWRPSPGAVYPTLAQLEDEGLVRTQADGGRKLATVTEAGQAYLADAATAPADPFAAFTEGAAAGAGRGLRDVVEAVHVAARTIGRTGTPPQVEAAKALLEKTRRELYLILADDPGPAAKAP